MIKKKILKYYPFWVGLIMCISLVGIGVRYDISSLMTILAYFVGFWKLGKFHG